MGRGQLEKGRRVYKREKGTRKVVRKGEANQNEI